MAEATHAELTNENYAATIGGGKWIVDFWATWCAPCRMQGRILEEGAEALEKAGIKVGKVNIDEEQQLAIRFNVASIPTLVLYKDGAEFRKFVGVQQLQTLIDAFK